MPTRALDGGCHCGAVRFRIEVDLDEVSVLDCDCSICRRKGFLHLIVDADNFVLIRGADALATYTFGTHTAQHHFCRTCGMHPFYRPRSHPESYDVNVRCLDDDVLGSVTIEPFDGQSWERSVTERWGEPTET